MVSAIIFNKGNYTTKTSTGSFDKQGNHGNYENNARVSNQRSRKCALGICELSVILFRFERGTV
jgi:hypothetical protein